MKHSLEEATRWQSAEVDGEFESRSEIEELEEELKLPTAERELERSDIEIQDDIDEEKSRMENHIKNHSSPISLTDCILPQMARIRIKESSKKHFRKYIPSVTESELKWGFFLLGEVLQASGHINVISDISGRVITMLHTEDFELIPPQEC